MSHWAAAVKAEVVILAGWALLRPETRRPVILPRKPPTTQYEVERREWVGWTRGRVIALSGDGTWRTVRCRVGPVSRGNRHYRARARPQAGTSLCPAMMAEEEPPTLCAICKRPILPGRGRYRTEEADVHEECYQGRHGRKPPGGK